MLSLKLVKVNLLTESSCLATPVVGPSTKTLLAFMTSITTANFPAKGPKLHNTTLPNSTYFLKTLFLVNMLPFILRYIKN